MRATTILLATMVLLPAVFSATYRARKPAPRASYASGHHDPHAAGHHDPHVAGHHHDPHAAGHHHDPHVVGHHNPQGPSSGYHGHHDPHTPTYQGSRRPGGFYSARRRPSTRTGRYQGHSEVFKPRPRTLSQKPHNRPYSRTRDNQRGRLTGRRNYPRGSPPRKRMMARRPARPRGTHN